MAAKRVIDFIIVCCMCLVIGWPDKRMIELNVLFLFVKCWHECMKANV